MRITLQFPQNNVFSKSCSSLDIRGLIYNLLQMNYCEVYSYRKLYLNLFDIYRKRGNWKILFSNNSLTFIFKNDLQQTRVKMFGYCFSWISKVHQFSWNNLVYLSYYIDFFHHSKITFIILLILRKGSAIKGAYH